MLAGSNAGAITVDGRLGFGLDQNYGTHRMIGDFDEARFFTFTAGQFNAAVDLSMTLRTVTYSGSGSDGGTVPADGAGYFPGTSVTTLGAGTMTRSGFAFAGWNTAAGGGGTAYGPAATFSSPDANTTLYAQWTPVSVTATPSFDPVAGGYVGARTATISSDAGSTIYYTTDGSAPAPS